MEQAVQRRNTVVFQDFVIHLIQMTVGTLIGAVSVILFFAPSNIAPAGISGIAVILNDLLGLPIGLVVLVGNVPIMFLAYRMLGGARAVIWTIYVVVLYSIAIDLLTPFFTDGGVSDDGLLNALFAGAVGGVGGGLIYRAGGSFGGTSTLAMILQEKFGLPLSSTFTYVNITIVGLAGVFLGWESALYSLVALMIEGAASDYVMEGPSVIRTVTIITDKPTDVSNAILYTLQRGVTGWEGKGMYTGQVRYLLFVTIGRQQVNTLRKLVMEVDPKALIVVGQGHMAYGEGFKQHMPK